MIRKFHHSHKSYVVDSIQDKDGQFVGSVIVPPTLNPNDESDKQHIVDCVNAIEAIGGDPATVGKLVMLLREFTECPAEYIGLKYLTIQVPPEFQKEANETLRLTKGTE
jgi:RNA-binding protein YlmH